MLKIIRITVWRLELALAKPYFLSGGRLRVDSLDATYVRLDTDEGLSGWGEGTPWGHTYVPAHGPGIRAGIETMAPSILGQDPCKPGVVERAMNLCLPGHLYAKGPVIMAVLDLASQISGLAMTGLIGGAFPGSTPVASSISTDTPQGMLANIQSYRERGYHAHSVKVGSDIEGDIARIRHLETHRRPDELIFYDVNRAWTRSQAISVMNAVSDLQVVFEQPCETLDDCLAVRRLTRQPISIDERLDTLADMTRIAVEGIGEIVNIKLNRVGGLLNAARIRDLALANGMKIAVMATGGSVLADTEAAILAQTIPPEHRFATWACQDMITVDPAPGQGSRSVDGTLTAPGQSGLGITPDRERLGEPVAFYEG
ncbi:MAG: enolase C-terminal domain-like protein [Pseudomonadota bacterium]